ncbi:autophagy-related 8 atg8 [Babesia ovis]|uniref:Autophagy-related protein n=1 Tax=Babesia ovis TaxID=5869 RepID=A0A9W5T9A1_BABOV|nr:autophagy-related 8 atg8 [Babesia ovis]
MAIGSTPDHSGSFSPPSLEGSDIYERFLNRIPVVCLPRNKTTVRINRSKFLVPANMMYAEFKYILQKHIVAESTANSEYIGKNATLYLYVGDVVPVSQAAIGDLFRKYRSPEGILYMTYANENSLG